MVELLVLDWLEVLAEDATELEVLEVLDSELNEDAVVLDDFVTLNEDEVETVVDGLDGKVVGSVKLVLTIVVVMTVVEVEIGVVVSMVSRSPIFIAISTWHLYSSC